MGQIPRRQFSQFGVRPKELIKQGLTPPKTAAEVSGPRITVSCHGLLALAWFAADTARRATESGVRQTNHGAVFGCEAPAELLSVTVTDVTMLASPC